MLKKQSKSKPDKKTELSVVDRISPIQKMDDFITAIFYGRSGTGKTTLSATFPKPLLLIDVKERGTRSIRDVAGVDAIPITQWEEFEELYYFLKDKGKKYATIVVDPLNGLQRLAMDKVKRDRGKEESDQISKNDWGQIGGLMVTWIGYYRDLAFENHHVVFTAHERTSGGGDETADDQIDPTVGPLVMPSVQSFVCGAVDFVGNTFIRERIIKKDGQKKRKVDYGLRVGPHGYYITKTRNPKSYRPPDVVLDPTYEKISKVSRGEELDLPVKKDVKAVKK